jgi:hypothetical protein
MVLGTAESNHAMESNRWAWLRAGEALQRILLEATRFDFVVSIASQVHEVSSAPRPPSQGARSRVSSTSPDEDRPSSSNTSLKAAS